MKIRCTCRGKTFTPVIYDTIELVNVLTMDFFASLPPEMVLNVLSNLDGEDGVRCLAVSKSWREVVGSQDGYWKKACVQFGLPEDLIEEHIQHKKCCASPVALFLAARGQRLYISGSSGIIRERG